MLFAAICLDKPNSLNVRLSARPAHLEFLEAHAARIKLGGPFLDAEERPIGSLLIVDGADLATAKALLDQDPYAKAGLFASVELKPFRRVVGAEL
ncbi:MAG: YciI family protein [Methylocystis sp.]